MAYQTLSSESRSGTGLWKANPIPGVPNAPFSLKFKWGTADFQCAFMQSFQDNIIYVGTFEMKRVLDK